jgi:hypothetical protein
MFKEGDRLRPPFAPARRRPPAPTLSAAPAMCRARQERPELRLCRARTPPDGGRPRPHAAGRLIPHNASQPRARTREWCHSSLSGGVPYVSSISVGSEGDKEKSDWPGTLTKIGLRADSSN